jgi:Ca2+-binding RTX toxin-like protein
MPTGYRITLGDGSLDTGDSLGTSPVSFTTATTLGSGDVTFTGRIGRIGEVQDYNLNGTYYEATDGNVYFVPSSTIRRFDEAEVDDAPSYSSQDGVVDGTGGDDLIDASYVDTQGDQVDDGVGTGASGMGDSIEAQDGDDTVQAGDGDDFISGGGGSDSIDAGDGDDTIYGDNVTTASSTSESLNWSSQGSDESDISGGFTQTTGVMDVTVGFSDDGNATGFTVESSSSTYVASGESFNASSMLELRGSGNGDTSTTTIDFTSNQPDSYSDNVNNLSFRIGDIDGVNNGWQDVITIRAVDANGDSVTIDLTGNGDDTVGNGVITASLSNDSFSSQSGSVLVEISGPVQSIEIDYDNGFSNGQILLVTDVHFDTIPVVAGDDTISGGEGDDLIYGEEGDDSLSGDAGSDTIVGGDGDDTLSGGADGDSLSGGAGMDFVDYSGSSAGVDVDLGAGTADGGDATGDTLAGGLDGIIGSDWDDTLTGYDAQGADWTNVFYGRGGDDILDGAGGDDSLYGGAGDDTLIGGDGADVLSGGDDDDVLQVGSGDTATGGSGDDTFELDEDWLGGGSISIEGGETGETTGDTLDFGGLLNGDGITYTNTVDQGGGLSGYATLVDGTVVNFENIENIIICFKAGTRISTPFGPRRVEDLRPGDMVVTRDNGVQPIRWTGRRAVNGTGDLAPIRFAPGSVGNARPLLVSPQHRMLIRSSNVNLLFNTAEAFVAARHLVNGSSIRRVEKASIDYVHILFDRHEVIFAEGAQSESYHPGRHGLNGILDHAREELFSIFPELRSDPESYGDTARPCLKEFEAKLLQTA